MKRHLCIAAAAALLIAIGGSGCKTAQPKATTKAEDAAALEAWAQYYVDRHGWPPETELEAFYEAQEAETAARLLNGKAE